MAQRLSKKTKVNLTKQKRMERTSILPSRSLTISDIRCDRAVCKPFHSLDGIPKPKNPLPRPSLLSLFLLPSSSYVYSHTFECNSLGLEYLSVFIVNSPFGIRSLIVDPFLSIVHRITPGSTRRVSFRFASTGGEVSKRTVK